MAVLQPIIDLAELCFQQGINHAVISPGSRSAAISLAFDKHEGITTHIVMDERAAGFIAMGIAQQLNSPVVLICTSGTAAYNFAPAVAEAFFQQIPLLVLTADRPPEWIHQQDGQTIFQSGIFGKHVKKSFDFPVDYHAKDSLWFANRIANEAILLTKDTPSGPVHINVPIREPFYPSASEKLESGEIRKITRLAVTPTISTENWHLIEDAFESFEKVIIAVGQMPYNEKLFDVLKRMALDFGVVVIGDNISNLPDCDPFIVHHDLFLSSANRESIQPELLITLGKSFISKPFKEFIRSNNRCEHWHIGIGSDVIDTFQHLSLQIPLDPLDFFNKLYEELDFQDFTKGGHSEYDFRFANKWMYNNLKSRRLISNFLKNNQELCDLSILDVVLDNLPEKCQLHLANSMSVRYVNFLGVPDRGIKVFANRGTSGIDGCVSTAIGAAIISEEPVYLIVGDVAFLYDRNGLLLESIPDNLKIIVMNNAGGNIFRIIEGSSSQKELERLFETRHAFSSETTARESKMDYYKVDSMGEITEQLNNFIGSKKASILECFTCPEVSAKVYKEAKLSIHSNWMEAE